MYSIIIDLDRHVITSMVKLDDVNLEACKGQLDQMQEISRETDQILLQLKGNTVGGREGRIIHSTIVNRMERTLYNLIRLSEVWHHAITSDWVAIEEL